MPLDQVLKKNFWIVVLPLVAVAALLGAQFVTQLIGMAMAPNEAQLAAASFGSKGTSTPATPRKVSADPILSRNPFDSVTGPLNATPEAAEAESAVASSGELDTSDPWGAPACDGVKVLVIAASTDPDWSFAALSASSDNKAVLRRRGGELSGKKVHFVGWDRVWFENSGALCQAKLFEEAQPKTPGSPAVSTPPVSTPTPPTRSGAKALDPGLAKGIQKTGQYEYSIDRGVVDKILENQADLMRQARIVPEQDASGKVVGIKMYGVRPDTLLGHLGMQNGDRLQTINGFDMASPEKALEAYARLRTADKLVVSLNRNGQNINLDYNIK